MPLLSRVPFLMPFLLPSLLCAQAAGPSARTQLTLYNGGFAVAREPITLDLHAGITDVVTTSVTRELEPDSVILRDPTGRVPVHILEQNYESAVINQQSMLRRFEGQTLQFNAGTNENGSPRLIEGKLIRAGEQNEQALVEVGGRLQFFLPGQPLFPAGTDGLLLKPSLHWRLESPAAAHLQAELAYLTGGMTWQASYNVLLAAGTDAANTEPASVLGWVTMQNTSGTSFPQASIKLMAGDVAKLAPSRIGRQELRGAYAISAGTLISANPTEKPFDDFHLYDLHRTLSLADGETKQVQFLTADNVSVRRVYQFDSNPANLQPSFNNYTYTSSDYGLPGKTSVTIQQQIRNTAANHLGMPLPAGRLRLYRRDSDGQLEFIGESVLHHTAQDDTVSVVIGNAFDLRGLRTQTHFTVASAPAHFTDEDFRIDLHNSKTEPVTIMVVEHLYRGSNWEIRQPSQPFHQVDSRTIEFPVAVAAGADASVTYQVHYTW